MENKVSTFITHSEDCCGCANGVIDHNKNTIEFTCNECGLYMGFIPIDKFIESINLIKEGE